MTRISKRNFSLALAAFALVAGTSAAQAQNALADIEKSKTIKIAIPTDFPPYGFAGLDLQPQGLDIDMAKLIAEKLGVKVELVPVISANRVPYLQTRKADLVISTLGKNAEREKVINFTHAYSPFYQGIFAPKSVTIKSFADLSNKTIAVTRGAMEDEELIKAGPADMNVKRFEDQAATTAAFAAGQTQVIASSISNVATLAQKNPRVDAEYKLLLKDSPNFIGIAKGEDALLKKVNEIILAAKADGTLEKMSQKWLKRGTGELPL